MSTQTTTDNRVQSYVNEKPEIRDAMGKTTTFVFQTLMNEIQPVFTAAGFMQQSQIERMDTAIRLWNGESIAGLPPDTSEEIVKIVKAYFNPLQVTECQSIYELDVANAFQRHETLSLEITIRSLNDEFDKALGLKVEEPLRIEFGVHIISAMQPNQPPIVNAYVSQHLPLVFDLDIADLRVLANLFHEHWRDVRTWANVRSSM